MSEDKHRLILRPKKSTAMWLLLCCSVFVVCGVWIAIEKSWIGYLCAGFFAMGIPVAVIQMIPGSTSLEIVDEGLSITNLFRVTMLPWHDVDHFFVVSLKQSGMTVSKRVGFNYLPSDNHYHVSRQVATAIAGCEGTLPDTYGVPAEELAAILNQCLAEFRKRLNEPSGQPGPSMTGDENTSQT